jgi:hypothetical protein
MFPVLLNYSAHRRLKTPLQQFVIEFVLKSFLIGIKFYNNEVRKLIDLNT